MYMYKLHFIQLIIFILFFVVFYKMNYYLAGQESKKKILIKALNQYARDRSVEDLAQSLKGILQMPVERRLLKEIR